MIIFAPPGPKQITLLGTFLKQTNWEIKYFVNNPKTKILCPPPLLFELFIFSQKTRDQKSSVYVYFIAYTLYYLHPKGTYNVRNFSGDFFKKFEFVKDCSVCAQGVHGILSHTQK